MELAEFKRRVKFILKFGRSLHSVGAPAHSLEGTLQEMCHIFGITGHIVSLPTAIFSSFSHGDEEITRIDRVQPMGVNLGKLSQVDLVARDVIAGKLSFEEGSESLDHILIASNPYGRIFRVLSFVLSSIGFLVLIGGNWGDFYVSLIVGALIGLLSLLQPTQSIGLIAQMFEALMAVVAAFFTYLCAKMIPGLNVGVVIISTLIVFMPGLFITMAIAEIATQNLTSGTSRLMGGIMILLKLTFGVYIGARLANFIYLPTLDFHFTQVPGWVSIIMLPIASLVSTIIYKADGSDWKWITLAGVFGYTCSKVATHYFGMEMGILLGGFCVGAASNIFARSMDRPSSIFQIPGIILLVPGSIGYKSFSFLFDNDIVGGLGTAFSMITVSMALVVGIFFGNILVKPRRSI